jgi:hypothetical protein
VIADQYLHFLTNLLSTVVNQNIVDKRYETVQNLIVGQRVAQTAGCWLTHTSLQLGQKYHTVLATDEFFTYANSAEQQQRNIESVVACTQQRLIITVRDFKNSHRHELCNHQVINHNQHTWIINETAKPSTEDRQAWSHDAYVVSHQAPNPASVEHIGSVQRRAVYFKQLAKFCFDAGCSSFRVLPNQLFKPIFKSHVEHVVVVDW